MLYREPFILSWPPEIIEDTRLDWMHRVAWAMIVKTYSKGDGACNVEVQNLLGIEYRRLKYIKAHLASCGHLTKIGEGKATRYLPVNREAETHSKIREFISLSSTGFAAITEGEIVELETRLPAEKILHTLEVLEWTYRKSSKKIGKPIHLLRSRLKTGVTPDEDFVSGWWKLPEEQKREQAARLAAEQIRKENDARDRAAMVDREHVFRALLAGMSEEERTTLELEAIERIKKNGGLVPFSSARRVQIRLAMMKISEERTATA